MINSDGIFMPSVDASVRKGCGGFYFYLKEMFNALDVSEGHVASQMPRDHFVSRV